MTCLRRKPGAGQLPVRVKAAGVDNWDALIREGKVELQSLPIILGSELSTAENWLRTSALCSRWRTRASPTRCLPAARIAAEDHARYRFPTLGTVEYSDAKVDQGFEAAAGFVDLSARARKDGHATLDHDIQASPRCRCRPGGGRRERRGRRRRRDGQAGCNARPAEPARQAPHRDRRHLCAGRQVGTAPPRWQRLGLCAVRGDPLTEFRDRSGQGVPGGGQLLRAASQHLVSENASTTESASLLAVHIADDGAGLTTIDK